MNIDKPLLFVSCAPALEPLLMQELHELGVRNLSIGYRGVSISEWDWATIYRINYASRLASRVLLPLTRFRCFDRQSLYKHTAEINWSNYLQEGQTFAIDANVYHPRLRNSLFAAQVVKDAICDQLRRTHGRRPSVDIEHPDVQINLFIQHQLGIISFDTSGDPLHKRGYRQESVSAPMQESLAAAILRLAEYDRQQIFLDPCCGSGTLLIEAALIASGTPPGYLRKRWGFMQHPDYCAADWLKVRNQIDSKRVPLLKDRLKGLDCDEEAVYAMKTNLKAAGFNQLIDVECADFCNYVPLIAPNFILTNPPYGRRLENVEELRPLYRALGSFMKRCGARPARGYIFTANLELAKEVGLAAKRRFVLSNGGVEARLLEYDLY